MANDPIEEAGFLVGLEDGAREERAELLAWLVEQGFTVEQLRDEPAAILLPGNRALGDDGSHASAREISETHGIDLELLQRIERAMGLPRVENPDAAVHLRADIEAAAHWQQVIDLGLEPDQVILLVRRLSDGLSRAIPAIRYGAMSAVLHPGATELQVAKAYEVILHRVAPLLGPLVAELLFVQFRHALEGEGINARERAAGIALPGARRLAVAFADMVGFTRLGEVIPPEELVGLVERLADLARDVAIAPVRLVKTIGDAVMLVSPDPVRLAETTLDLSEAADRDDTLPELRIGIAWGQAVSRARDWFGSPVNVASRITGVAQPGTVLVSGSARRVIGRAEGLRWEFVGAPRLKGVPGETKLFKVRREATGGAVDQDLRD